MEDRKLQVLRAIVTDYVSSQEPVGSKALVDKHDLGVSPATVRNDMAALEEEGYITQPHTSAGRIPTDKGYRLFVDRLGTVKPLSAAEQRAIQTFLSGALDLDDILLRTVRLLAQATQQVAIVQYPTLSHSTVRHVELVSLSATRVLLVLITSTGRVEQRSLEVPELDEDVPRRHADAPERGYRRPEPAGGRQRALRAAGRAARADAPARPGRGLLAARDAGQRDLEPDGHRRHAVPDALRHRPSSMKPVLEALEEQVVLLTLLGEATADVVTVRIGQENPYKELQTTSVVASGYGSRATLGVVGPTRMDYPSTMASVRAVARYVGRFLAQG